MSNKLVWSNHGTADYAYGLSDEEKRNYLIDRGYDPEMLGDNDLDSVIADDDYMWQEDAEDFEFNVKPMIENQCRDGKVVLVGSVGRWDGARDGGAIVDPEDLINLDRDVIDVEIEDDGEGLVYNGHHHDGTISMDLYHFSDDSDKYKEELEALGVFDEYAKWYDDIEDVWSLSVGDLESYIDFSKVPEVLSRVVNKMNEDLGRSLEEAKSKDPAGLADELEEIKPLAKDYGFEYFSSMPFTDFDDDPTSIEFQYPEFFRIAKSFFKEMDLVDDPNDADELDAQWDSIDSHDWDVIIKVCDKLANGAPAQQFEKVFKDGMDDHLGDDKEILKKRAEEDEFNDLDAEDDAYAWMDDAENPMDNESLEETNADKTNKKLKDKEEARRILDIANSGKVGSSEAQRLRLLAVKKQLGEDVGDEFIGKKVRIVNLSELPPADFGIDDNATEDEIADYEEMMAHEGEIATITNCVDQVENHSLEGYWDVKFEDGFEIPALADYHMELVEDESLDEALPDDMKEFDNPEVWPWGSPRK